MSSNLLFFQDHDTLYLAGGYGQDSQGNWVTYPILSSVHLPSLVEGVMRDRIPSRTPLRSYRVRWFRLPEGTC